MSSKTAENQKTSTASTTATAANTAKRTFLVTGANGEIGREIALGLAKDKSHAVVLAVRDKTKGKLHKSILCLLWMSHSFAPNCRCRSSKLDCECHIQSERFSRSV
jgi:hypothetical protein